MAAGTPVVATETDGARELLSEADALVPVKDPLALANTICRFIENKDQRLQLGASLSKTARERFSLGSMVDATEALYQQLADQR